MVSVEAALLVKGTRPHDILFPVLMFGVNGQTIDVVVLLYFV